MLRDGGVGFTRRDFFKDRFTVSELGTLLTQAKVRPGDVLSRRSRAYKEFIGDRESSFTDAELFDLMAREPTLLRRPLAVNNGRLVTGFDEKALLTLADAAAVE